MTLPLSTAMIVAAYLMFLLNVRVLAFVLIGLALANELFRWFMDFSALRALAKAPRNLPPPERQKTPYAVEPIGDD